MKLDPTVAVAELKELEELRKFKENHKDGWAYAEKMDALRQEAETRTKQLEEEVSNSRERLANLVPKIAARYCPHTEREGSPCSNCLIKATEAVKELS